MDNKDQLNTDTPRWLMELRRRCRRHSQSHVAKQLGYSTAVINQVLAGKYKGNVARFAETVRRVYLGETVICPIMGELELHRCRRFQKEPFAATNPTRVRRYRACRSGCPHSELKEC